MKKYVYVLLAFGVLQLSANATDKENRHLKVNRFLADHETLDNLDTFEDIRQEAYLSPLSPAPLNITWIKSFDPEVIQNVKSLSSKKAKKSQKVNRFVEYWETVEEENDLNETAPIIQPTILDSVTSESLDISIIPTNDLISAQSFTLDDINNSETLVLNSIDMMDQKENFKVYLRKIIEIYPDISWLNEISDQPLEDILRKNTDISHKEILSQLMYNQASTIRESNAFNNEQHERYAIVTQRVTALANACRDLNDDSDEESTAESTQIESEQRIEEFKSYFKAVAKEVKSLNYLNGVVTIFPLTDILNQNKTISNKQFLIQFLDKWCANIKTKDEYQNKENIKYPLARKAYKRLLQAQEKIEANY